MTTTTLTRLAYALAFATRFALFVGAFYMGSLVHDLGNWPVAFAWALVFVLLRFVVVPVMVTRLERAADEDEARENEAHLARMRDLFGDDEADAFADYESAWRARTSR